MSEGQSDRPDNESLARHRLELGTRQGGRLFRGHPKNVAENVLC